MRRTAFGFSLIALALAAAPLAAEGPSWTPVGPDGGLVRDLATSPALPGWIFASIPDPRNPLFRSADRGRTWEMAPAQGLTGRQVGELALSADGRTLFAATADGLLRSGDRGDTWGLIGPGDDEEPRSAYTSIETHPRRPGLVLAVQAAPNGPEQILLRSTDRGTTWTTDPSWPERVQALAFGPEDTVYAGTDARGFWKSTDAGRTWRPTGQGLPAGAQVTSLAVDPRNARIVYAGLPVLRRSLFKSTDGGATWKPSQRGLAAAGRPVQPVMDIVLDRSDPSIVYTLVGTALFRSLDQGREWTRLLGPPGQMLPDLEPAGYGLLAATPLGIFLSTDRGALWRHRNTGLSTARIFDMALGSRDQDPPRLYALANGRLLRTDVRGGQWLLAGPAAERFSLRYTNPASMAVAPGEPETVYWSESNTLARSPDGGLSWTYLESDCHLLSNLLVDPQDAEHLYATTVLINGCGGPITQAMVSSEDGGETWKLHPGPLATPLAFDPFDGSFYFQDLSGNLGRVAGDTVETLFPDLDATAFAVSPHTPGTLWAAVVNGAVGRSVDGGRTWSFSSAGLPGTALSHLAPDPADPGTVYGAHVFHGVFKSTDAGATWSPVGSWPGLSIQGGILVDPADPSILYAGSDTRGVLRFDQEE